MYIQDAKMHPSSRCIHNVQDYTAALDEASPSNTCNEYSNIPSIYMYIHVHACTCM